MTDEQFLTAIGLMLQGNQEGLRQIYDVYFKLIYYAVYDILGHKEETEDIVSEFFIKLVRIAPSYQGGNGHKTWMVTIARNMALDYIRKNRREVLSENSDTADFGEAVQGGADNSCTAVDRMEEGVIAAQDINNAMKQLESREKEVIDLKIIGQFKFREIADMLGQPPGTVSWLYNQGIKKLRRYLSDYE